MGQEISPGGRPVHSAAGMVLSKAVRNLKAGYSKSTLCLQVNSRNTLMHETRERPVQFCQEPVWPAIEIYTDAPCASPGLGPKSAPPLGVPFLLGLGVLPCSSRRDK